MSKRVLALVRRSGGGSNITDETPTVVYEHEVPLLEEIHGSVEVISDPEKLLDDEVRKDRAQQIDHIAKTMGLGIEFAGDPFEEFQRMQMKYGMHPEIRTSVVEKVYGDFRSGSFTRACGTMALESLSSSQLRDMCDELGISFKASDTKPILIDAVRAAKRAEAEQVEVSRKHSKAA